jgi:hypothetical protein
MYAFLLIKLLVTLIPPTVLLTISFFVLVVLRKVENKNLKAFGRCVVLLLWVAASTIFLSGIYVISKGSCPLNSTKSHAYGEMMRGSYHGAMAEPHPGIMEKQSK